MEANSQKAPQVLVSGQYFVVSTLSQSILIVITLISTIPLVTGFYFIWHEQEGAWIPLSLFTFLITLVSIAWWHLHRVIDRGKVSLRLVTDCQGNCLVVLKFNNTRIQLAILMPSLDSRNPQQEPGRLINAEEKRNSGTKEQANLPKATCGEVITIEPDRSS
ncbi:MAG: hypothetical protein M0Q95_19585 [Porticoccaceae bacterium]|nr:hypothetical protein [Porticoccaceae bacterium]